MENETSRKDVSLFTVTFCGKWGKNRSVKRTEDERGPYELPSLPGLPYAERQKAHTDFIEALAQAFADRIHAKVGRVSVYRVDGCEVSTYHSAIEGRIVTTHTIPMLSAVQVFSKTIGDMVLLVGPRA